MLSAMKLYREQQRRFALLKPDKWRQSTGPYGVWRPDGASPKRLGGHQSFQRAVPDCVWVPREMALKGKLDLVRQPLGLRLMCCHPRVGCPDALNPVSVTELLTPGSRGFASNLGFEIQAQSKLRDEGSSHLLLFLLLLLLLLLPLLLHPLLRHTKLGPKA